MTINYQFGDVDARGATTRAQAASLEAEHPNAHGKKVRNAGSNMAGTDIFVGSSWALTPDGFPRRTHPRQRSPTAGRRGRIGHGIPVWPDIRVLHPDM